MSDDPRFPNNPDDSQDEPEISASVTFMEMMRQAAAKANPPPPVPTKPKTTSQAANVPATNEGQLSDTQRAQALEEQRILRVKRRKARRRRQTVGVLGGIIRSFIVVIVAAGLTATIFTWWTPSRFIAEDVQAGLSVALATSQVTVVPTGLPTPNWLRKVGVVTGHRGPEGDPGAVCDDGLTEAEINFAVAQLVVRNLRGRGYSVDLLDEFDPRLDNYQAAALVSIHANTCQDFGELVSGFLVAAAAARVTARGNDEILVNCIAQYYGQATGLQRRDGVTVDMTDYHTFREIHPVTPAAIIELGFLLGDREILTTQQEAMSQAITDGILCFLEPGASGTTVTPPAG